MRSASPWARLRDLLGHGREGVRPDLQLALLRLDDDGRKQLRQRCGGNWNLVTVSEDGTFTVHVGPQPDNHHAVPSGHERMTVAARPRQARDRLTDWLPGFRHWVLAAALELLAAVVQVCHSAARWVVKQFLVILGDALALFEREPPAGAEPFDWRAVDLHRVAPRVAGLWRQALMAAQGFVYRDETWTRFGVDGDVVAATLAHPDRVEMHPLSFSPLARQAVMSFQRADVTVILWFRDPAYPEVAAVLIGRSLRRDGDPGGTRGDCACGAAHNVPSSYWELRERLTALGAVVEPDEFGLLAKVTYAGQDVGTVNAGDDVSLAVVHTDWWRTVWWMQAVDQRGPVY